MWYHGFISVHHPYYDFGILETNVGNSKRSAARLSFFNRGQFSEHPGSGFVCGICSLLPAGRPWLRKTNYRQTKATRTFHESTTTDADHSTYTTEQYYYAYEVDGTDYTNVHSIYPYNKKLHAEAKSAECEIFYHPKKPKKMFCPEDIAKDYYTIWILRFLIGGTIIATDFYF